MAAVDGFRVSEHHAGLPSAGGARFLRRTLELRPPLEKSEGVDAGRAAHEPARRPWVVVGAERTVEEALVETLRPTVTRLIWTFMGADPERDDVAQEIFFRILKGAANVREPANVEAWAVRLTMNYLKDEFRRRKVRRWLSFDPLREADHPRVHPDFQGRELLIRTNNLLEKLPLRERMPLTLQLFEAADLERIAELCGCSVSTAKRRLRSARLRFESLARQDPLLASRVPAKAEAGADDE